MGPDGDVSFEGLRGEPAVARPPLRLCPEGDVYAPATRDAPPAEPHTWSDDGVAGENDGGGNNDDGEEEEEGEDQKGTKHDSNDGVHDAPMRMMDRKSRQ